VSSLFKSRLGHHMDRSLYIDRIENQTEHELWRRCCRNNK